MTLEAFLITVFSLDLKNIFHMSRGKENLLTVKQPCAIYNAF